ncbi:hypothetical protein B0H14DRAFT_3517157 [Mycena olivaceomarginata]|nr:hypothetical protein B0H14DRAFT_3517157 [Mycena olivaceomarginata]
MAAYCVRRPYHAADADAMPKSAPPQNPVDPAIEPGTHVDHAIPAPFKVCFYRIPSIERTCPPGFVDDPGRPSSNAGTPMILTPIPRRIITRHKTTCVLDVLEWVYGRLGPRYFAGVNQMEREMCNYLDWELTVDNPILRLQGHGPGISLQLFQHYVPCFVDLATNTIPTQNHLDQRCLWRVSLCFGPPSIERVHADHGHGRPNIALDRPPTQNHLFLGCYTEGVWVFLARPLLNMCTRTTLTLTPRRIHTPHKTLSIPKVYRRFGWSVTDRVHAVRVGAASPPDQYPTQNLDYLGQILSKFL